jgi:hypothetical protein
MGKLVTVNQGYSAVLLPSTYGLRNYNPGDQVTVTDAEYAAFNAATTQAITLTTSGLPDPARPSSDKFAESVATQTFSAASGGTLTTGVNVVTGPAGGVTYATGFLTVAANNPGASPAVVGPVSGSQTDIELYHIQGAVVSVAPTAKGWFSTGTTKWPGGVVPTFTASVGAIDYFRFITPDGGVTWYNVNTTKGLA